jgi:type I restriction enzyme, S subunit
MEINIKDGYKVTEVGVIPDDWEVWELSQVVENERPISYGIVQTGKYIENGVRCIRVIDIVNGKVNKDNLITTSEEISNSYKRTILRNGDLIIALRGKIGELAIIDKDLVGSNLTRGLALIATKYNNYNYFLYYYLSSPNSKLILERNLNGSALKEISIGVLRKITIPLPPLSEQKAIAHALSDVDNLITAIDQLITKKRNIRQGTMQQLLTGKKRLPGFSSEWEVKKLGDMVIKIVGGGTPSRNIKDYWNGNIFWATVKDFTSFSPYETQETITQEGLNSSASNLIPKGNLIISTRMAVGKIVIYNVDVAINQDLKGIFTKPDIDTKFLFYCFTNYSSNINFLASGSTVKGIILEDLKNIEFPYISLTEQKAISEILSDIDKEIEALEKNRDKYKAIKQGMMQELLTGKTRIIDN